MSVEYAKKSRSNSTPRSANAIRSMWCVARQQKQLHYAREWLYQNSNGRKTWGLQTKDKIRMDNDVLAITNFPRSQNVESFAFPKMKIAPKIMLNQLNGWDRRHAEQIQNFSWTDCSASILCENLILLRLTVKQTKGHIQKIEMHFKKNNWRRWLFRINYWIALAWKIYRACKMSFPTHSYVHTNSYRIFWLDGADGQWLRKTNRRLWDAQLQLK